MNELAQEGGDQRRVALFLGVLLVAAIAWGLQQSILAIHENWTYKYGHFAHGYLVLAIAVWLAIRGWKGRPLPGLAPWLPAIPILAGLTIVMSVSMLLTVGSAIQSLLPVMLLATVAAVYGLPMARIFFWPLAYLYFALPIWWLTNTPLQQLTALVANGLVALTGIPAHVEGNHFFLPAGVIEVAAGCSGLNYLVTALALGFLEGMMHLRLWKNRLKLLAAAALLALVSNWVRVYSLLLVGYVTDMQSYLIRVDHLTYGWVLFLLFLVPMVFYARHLESREAVSAVAEPKPVAEEVRPARARNLVAATAGVALLLVVPQWFSSALSRAAGADPGPPPLTGAPVPDAPSLLPGAREERVQLVHEGQSVVLYRAYVGQQSDALTLSESGIELPGPGWERLPTPVQDSQSAIPGHVYIARHAGANYVVRTGLVVAGRPSAGRLHPRIDALRGALALRTGTSVWMLLYPCAGQCESAVTASALLMEDPQSGIQGQLFSVESVARGDPP